MPTGVMAILPPAPSIVIVPPASARVTDWPPGVTRRMLSCSGRSSTVTREPPAETMLMTGFPGAICSGGVFAEPQRLPMT